MIFNDNFQEKLDSGKLEVFVCQNCNEYFVDIPRTVITCPNCYSMADDTPKKCYE